MTKNIGLLPVIYYADQLDLTPNYFGDLIKKETGSQIIEISS